MEILSGDLVGSLPETVSDLIKLLRTVRLFRNALFRNRTILPKTHALLHIVLAKPETCDIQDVWKGVIREDDLTDPLISFPALFYGMP